MWRLGRGSPTSRSSPTCTPRRIVGWNVAATLKADILPLQALDMAAWHADGRLDGLVHHADHGSNYLALAYTDRMTELGATPSTGSVGDSYDCEHRDCATIWGLTLAYDRPCGCPRVDVSAPGGGVHQAAGRVGSDLIGA